jgi:hypothetical protein
VRRTLAVVAVVAAASLTALILGEYQLTLWTGMAAGVIVGVLLGEIVLGIARWRGWLPALGNGLLAAGALVWAGWIESGQGVAPMRSTVWLAAGVAAAVGVARLRPTASR